MRSQSTAIVLLFIACGPALAQQEIRLWPGKAPGTENWTIKESVVTSPGGGTAIANVSDPTLTVYLPAKAQATGTAVIVAPGGGLRFLGMDPKTVKFLNDKGIAAFVLKYRTLQSQARPGGGAPNAPGPSRVEMEIRNANANPVPDDPKATEVLHMAVADMQTALRLVRRNAKEWGVDTKKVGILAYSAGGGVAIGTALAPPGDAYPDFIISAFGPSLQDVVVPAHAPPLFMAVVQNHFNVTNGLVALFVKWKAANKPVELHVYDMGNPPLTIRPQGRPTEVWIERAYEWLQLHDFAPQPASWAVSP